MTALAGHVATPPNPPPLRDRILIALGFIIGLAIGSWGYRL